MNNKNKFHFNSNQVKLTDAYLLLSDGNKLFVKKNIFDDKNIVICIHGLGAHAGSFKYLQRYLTKNKISNLSIDLRGFGHWKNKGDIEDVNLYMSDLDELMQTVKKNYPNKKITLLGESLGSMIILWYNKFNPKFFDSIILTSVVTHTNPTTIHIPTALKAAYYYLTDKSKKIATNFKPQEISSDKEFNEWVIHKDIYGAKKISIRFLLQAKEIVDLKDIFIASINKPILMLQADNDIFSTKDNVDKLFSRIPFENKSIIYIKNSKHSIINDVSRKNAFYEMIKWLKSVE